MDNLPRVRASVIYVEITVGYRRMINSLSIVPSDGVLLLCLEKTFSSWAMEMLELQAWRWAGAGAGGFARMQLLNLLGCVDLPQKILFKPQIRQ